MKHRTALAILREEEDRAVRELRFRVDLVCALLTQQNRLSLQEALALTRAVKRFALARFPDKGDTFDLVYGTRLRRILMERFPVC